MENLSNLDQAIQILESRCEGLIVAEEQPDGKMKYTVTNETACYGLYSTAMGPNYMPSTFRASAAQVRGYM